MLEAYAGLKPQMPDIRLIVIGGDGGLRQVCERYVYQNGLEDVVFAGYVPEEEKPRYFRTADVYCAPNTGAESLGLVLLEAMAAGTPIVASRIEGFADVLRHEREGLLVAPRDSRALAGALKRLLCDEGAREAMGKQASKTARRYAWDRMAGRVLDFYEETAAGRSSVNGGGPAIAGDGQSPLRGPDRG